MSVSFFLITINNTYDGLSTRRTGLFEVTVLKVSPRSTESVALEPMIKKHGCFSCHPGREHREEKIVSFKDIPPTSQRPPSFGGSATCR